MRSNSEQFKDINQRLPISEGVPSIKSATFRHTNSIIDGIEKTVSPSPIRRVSNAHRRNSGGLAFLHKVEDVFDKLKDTFSNKQTSSQSVMSRQSSMNSTSRRSSNGTSGSQQPLKNFSAKIISDHNIEPKRGKSRPHKSSLINESYPRLEVLTSNETIADSVKEETSNLLVSVPDVTLSSQRLLQSKDLACSIDSQLSAKTEVEDHSHSYDMIKNIPNHVHSQSSFSNLPFKNENSLPARLRDTSTSIPSPLSERTSSKNIFNGMGRSSPRLRDLMQSERSRSRTASFTQNQRLIPGDHDHVRRIGRRDPSRSHSLFTNFEKSSPATSTSCPTGLNERCISVLGNGKYSNITSSAAKRSVSVDANLNKQLEFQKRNLQHKKSSATLSCSRTLTHIIETDRVYSKIENFGITGYNCDYGAQYGRVNQYIIQEEIGSGAYGRVMKCRSEADGKSYACKILSKNKLKSKFRQVPWQGGTHHSIDEYRLGLVKREIAILKKLSKHPNINSLVEVVDDEHEDNLYMFFELCQRCIMKLELNHPAEPYTEDIAWKYFRDMTQGLEYLHAKKIVHRDIKPDNLLITFNDHVQLADFGISNIFEENQEHYSVSNGNTSMMFAAPELADEEGDDIHKKLEHGIGMDIWALGITLYCMMHGHAPFQDRLPMILFAKISNDDVVLANELSDSLKDLLHRLLTKDARSRITMPEIKTHPWVTKDGTIPMDARQDSMIYDEITSEDVENALSPAIKVVLSKFIKLFKDFSNSSLMKRPRTMDDLRNIGKPKIEPKKSNNSLWKFAMSRSSLKISPSVDVLNNNPEILASRIMDDEDAISPGSKVSILGEGMKSLGLKTCIN